MIKAILKDLLFLAAYPFIRLHTSYMIRKHGIGWAAKKWNDWERKDRLRNPDFWRGK